MVIFLITWKSISFCKQRLTHPRFPLPTCGKCSATLLKRRHFSAIIVIVWCTLESGINHSAIYCLLQSVLPECQPHLLKMNHSLYWCLCRRRWRGGGRAGEGRGGGGVNERKKIMSFLCPNIRQLWPENTNTYTHGHRHARTHTLALQRLITRWTLASFTVRSRAGQCKAKKQ